MSRAVHVAFDFGPDHITAQWRIGEREGSELCWEAPPSSDDDPSFCTTDDGHALVLEALAIIHFPHVETLTLTLPADHVEAHGAALQRKFTGTHELRNTECRSQRLTVNVRRVEVVARPG